MESTTNREELVFGPSTVAVIFGAASTTKVIDKEFGRRCCGAPVKDCESSAQPANSRVAEMFANGSLASNETVNSHAPPAPTMAC